MGRAGVGAAAKVGEAPRCRALTEGSKKKIHRRPRRTLRDGGTNSEGQVKYWRCTFFGHATPDRQERVPTASNVGSGDVTSASQPTPLIPFSRLSRAPFLRQSGTPTTKNKPAVRTLTAILRRAELTREFRFPFSDFGENHDHRDRRACLYDRRHAKARCRRSDLAALPGDELR